MSSRNANLYLQDILQACDDILNFTQGMNSAAELQNDRRTFLAVIHSLEIIGEAARQIPENVRQSQPEIQWREIAAMRNKLTHEYFGVNTKVIWRTVHEDLPIIIPLLKKMLR